MNDNNESATFAVIFLAVLGLGATGLIWGARACALSQDKTFGPAEEQVKRETFEQTKAYRDGLRRDFDELILAYARAKSDDERSVILGALRHRAEGAPPELVPPEVTKLISLAK